MNFVTGKIYYSIKDLEINIINGIENSLYKYKNLINENNIKAKTITEDKIIYLKYPENFQYYVIAIYFPINLYFFGVYKFELTKIDITLFCLNKKN